MFTEYHEDISWDLFISGLKDIILEDKVEIDFPWKSLTLTDLKATIGLSLYLVSSVCLPHKVTLIL